MTISSLRRQQRGIEDHFPQVTIGIREVARVAAPERGLRRLDDGGARQTRTLHRGIGLLRAAHVVTEAERRRARRRWRDARIMREILAGEEGELRPRLQIEKRDRAMGKFP